MHATEKEWLTAVQVMQWKDLVFTSIHDYESVPVMIYSDETKQMREIPIEDHEDENDKLI